MGRGGHPRGWGDTPGVVGRDQETAQRVTDPVGAGRGARPRARPGPPRQAAPPALLLAFVRQDLD